jgi:hypothetical protein
MMFVGFVLLITAPGFLFFSFLFFEYVTVLLDVLSLDANNWVERLNFDLHIERCLASDGGRNDDCLIEDEIMKIL